MTPEQVETLCEAHRQIFPNNGTKALAVMLADRDFTIAGQIIAELEQPLAPIELQALIVDAEKLDAGRKVARQHLAKGRQIVAEAKAKAS